MGRHHVSIVLIAVIASTTAALGATTVDPADQIVRDLSRALDGGMSAEMEAAVRASLADVELPALVAEDDGDDTLVAARPATSTQYCTGIFILTYSLEKPPIELGPATGGTQCNQPTHARVQARVPDALIGLAFADLALSTTGPVVRGVDGYDATGVAGFATTRMVFNLWFTLTYVDVGVAQVE